MLLPRSFSRALCIAARCGKPQCLEQSRTSRVDACRGPWAHSEPPIATQAGKQGRATDSNELEAPGNRWPPSRLFYRTSDSSNRDWWRVASPQPTNRSCDTVGEYRNGARHWTQTASGRLHTRLASTPPSTHASWPSRRARSRSHCVRARCTWPGWFGFVCSATQPGRTGIWADRARAGEHATAIETIPRAGL